MFAAFAVFAVVLTTFGTGEASTTITIEAETMHLAKGNGSVVSDSSASNGKALLMWSNDQATATVDLTGSASSLTLRVKGDQLNGPPAMNVSLDGQLIYQGTVPNTSWANVQINQTISAGQHTLGIAFTNDAYQKGVGDRNLRVDKIDFNLSSTTPSTGSTTGFEAETMHMVNGKGSVLSDSSASNGKALDIWSNDRAETSISLPAAATSLTVRAKGDQLNGAPWMNVYVDGQKVFGGSVPQTSWTTFRIDHSMSTGSHTIGIEFTNDAYQAGVGDRNLWIDRVDFTLSGQTTPPPTTNPQPPAGGEFQTLPPGSTLPSDAQCAAQVHRSNWEPRPDNTTANHTTGTTMSSIDGADATGNAKFAPRVDGNFTGTTDEIIQWAACKWGFNVDIVRAVAVQESTWHMSTVGDNGQSFGLMQIKRTVHTGTYPASANSTAFNVDYALAWRRACFEGYFNWVPKSAKGDEWGCVGLWFSGSWNSSGAQNYVAKVKQHLADRTWVQPGF